MQSIHKQIEKLIKGKRRGNVLFASYFKSLGSGDRITSYNVCYTKLLRSEPAGK